LVSWKHAVIRSSAAVLRACDWRSRTPEGLRCLLVCAVGGLGNTILLAPLLKTLREQLPGCPIDLLLSNRAALNLARELGWVDDIIWMREEDWHYGLASLRFFASVIRRRRYDAVLRTFLTSSGTLRGSFAVFLSGARIRVVHGDFRDSPFDTHLIPPDESRPEVERHLALGEILGFEAVSRWERFEVPERGQRWAEGYLAARGWDPRNPLLGIHPGCDPLFSAKRWPAERFGWVAAAAKCQLGLQPLVLGGGDDAEAVGKVLATAGPGVLSALGQDVIQTAGLIERCSLFLSNDSGLMHLASALEVPTLALFGPSNYVKARPLGSRTEVLRLGLECSPCDKETAMFRCVHHDCLQQLSAETVMAALGKMAGSLTSLAGRHVGSSSPPLARGPACQ